MNSSGYSGADLYITEFGVPSYLGFHNAGAAGRIDQANWYAEAFGVIDSWGNDKLKAMVAHMVLDNQYGAVNDTVNAFDNDPNTPDGGATVNSENAFALFERMTAGGPIVEKPVVALMRAVASGDDFITSSYRVINRISTDGIDVSRWGSNGVGLANGYIILTHGGDDTVFGSAYCDSLFAGDGDDIVNGGASHDRIYGGRGADIIFGGDGNYDLYDNSGDDRLNDGAGTNRIDGGTGWDVVEITGASANFNWSGDGRSILITGAMQSTRAINVEKIYFTVDQVMVTLTDADVSIGNGGVAETSVPPTYPDVTVLGTSGADTLVGTWENDVFQGGLGDDTLLGDVGSDIYIYTSGDGNDYIDDEAGFTDNTDVLLLTVNGGVKNRPRCGVNVGHLWRTVETAGRA